MEIKITLANDQYTAIVNAEVVKATKWYDTMTNFIMKHLDDQIVYDENDAKITALKKCVERKIAKASAQKSEAPKAEVETCSCSCKQSGEEIVGTYITEDGIVITIIR